MVRSFTLFFLPLSLAAQVQLGRPPSYTPVAKTTGTTTNPIKLTSGSSWIDTTVRATVATAYLSTLVPSTAVPTGWTGNVSTGNAGSTTQAYQDAVALRINWYRPMAGIASAVTFSSTYNSGDQQAALMMSVNGQINHAPPSTWTNYTATGADAAAHSNLCLEIPYIADPGCVANYIQDHGATNPDVGHRRWLLYPQTQNMGTGDVQPAYPTPFANALWAIDSHFSDARPATRDGFVAWPPKGYVPYQVVPGRWSFSYPSADFTNAVVTMQRSGGAVAIRKETPVAGFGENTLVWVPDNIDTNVSTIWPKPVVDTPIVVTLTHVLVAGVDTTFSYTVTIFDPSSTMTVAGHILKAGSGLAGVTVTLGGSQTATTDSAGAYSFVPLTSGTYLVSPALTGSAFTPSSLSVSATTSSADFTAITCDFNGVPAAINADPQGNSDGLSVSITAGCPWTATSNASWLKIASSTASGVGPIAVTFSYAANHGLARAATMTIATKAISVTQSSAGVATPGPASSAVFLNGRWNLDKNANGMFDAGDASFTFQINGVGDKPIVGDWNGSGVQKVGVFNSGFWALDYNGNGQWDGVVTDRFYGFGGTPGEIPVVGDWNGDGRAKIGVFHDGFWALDYNGNGQWDGPLIDRFYGFGGVAGDIPIVGDWNGDGRSKVGVFRSGYWALDYDGDGQWDGPVIDRYVSYSLGATERPVIGDWTGSGTTKIGSFRDGFWVLDTNGSFAYESSDSFCGFGGNPGEMPIVGDWNGDGRSKIGIFINGFWILDYNGNCRWDGLGPGNDRFVGFGGSAGEVPIPGKWQ